MPESFTIPSDRYEPYSGTKDGDLVRRVHILRVVSRVQQTKRPPARRNDGIILPPGYVCVGAAQSQCTCLSTSFGRLPEGPSTPETNANSSRIEQMNCH